MKHDMERDIRKCTAGCGDYYQPGDVYGDACSCSITCPCGERTALPDGWEFGQSFVCCSSACLIDESRWKRVASAWTNYVAATAGVAP